MNNLNDFTTEELKAELKIRMQNEKAIKEEERKNAQTCRNCKYLKFTENLGHYYYYQCSKRTYIIKSRNNLICNYKVHLSNTCDLFERKEE